MIGRLLCIIGIHAWHRTVRVAELTRFSKLICARCGARKWWRVQEGGEG